MDICAVLVFVYGSDCTDCWLIQHEDQTHSPSNAKELLYFKERILHSTKMFKLTYILTNLGVI